MGTYLSKPITDKESDDYSNGWLSCGSSSMQGWRESQEDAHNCLLDFDKRVALFAVYDGHGGAEVAQYAAEKLPLLVKNTLYDNQDYEKALIKAFMDFDDSLIEAPIIEKLIALREDINEECADEEEEREELTELYEEAKIPIEDIIQKYKNKIIENVDQNKESVDKPSSSKESPISESTSIVESNDACGSSSSSSSKTVTVESNDACGSSSSSSSKTITVESNDACGSSSSSSSKTVTVESNDACGSSSSSSSKTVAVESNDACGSSSSKTVTDDDKINVGNGIDECKPNDPAVESSPSSKVNGTPNDDEENDETEEFVAISSEDEIHYIASSSNGQNGSENNFDTFSLIFEDTDDDTDEEGEEFEDSMKLDDDSDSDSEDDEDNILSKNYTYEVEDDDDKPGRDSGCTAVMALLVNNKLYVANAGDSRCVVSVGGKAHDMSKDHKPEDEPELKRICKAGGRVSSDGRVNGGLNLSRALGDHNYKKNKDLPNTEQMITALPDVTVMDITPDDNNFIVLACDGIWNSLSSQEVVDFILERINKPDISLSSICEELFEQCLAPNTLSDGTGCDNMTCIIVKLKQQQKRSRSDDEDEDSEGGESKKHKSDSTEPESVQ